MHRLQAYHVYTKSASCNDWKCQSMELCTHLTMLEEQNSQFVAVSPCVKSQCSTKEVVKAATFKWRISCSRIHTNTEEVFQCCTSGSTLYSAFCAKHSLLKIITISEPSFWLFSHAQLWFTLRSWKCLSLRETWSAHCICCNVTGCFAQAAPCAFPNDSAVGASSCHRFDQVHILTQGQSPTRVGEIWYLVMPLYN